MCPPLGVCAPTQLRSFAADDASLNPREWPDGCTTASKREGGVRSHPSPLVAVAVRGERVAERRARLALEVDGLGEFWGLSPLRNEATPVSALGLLHSMEQIQIAEWLHRRRSNS
ncbi:hypothetical protein MRX96_002790 [Rhipicephalus microplus]